MHLERSVIARCPMLISFALAAASTGTAHAASDVENTLPHPVDPRDFPILKDALRSHLKSKRDVVVYIGTARKGDSGTIYHCGLMARDELPSLSMLFFAEQHVVLARKSGKLVEVLAIDEDPASDTAAKSLCDALGFDTPHSRLIHGCLQGCFAVAALHQAAQDATP